MRLAHSVDELSSTRGANDTIFGDNG